MLIIPSLVLLSACSTPGQGGEDESAQQIANRAAEISAAADAAINQQIAEMDSAAAAAANESAAAQ